MVGPGHGTVGVSGGDHQSGEVERIGHLFPGILGHDILFRRVELDIAFEARVDTGADQLALPANGRTS